MPSVTMTTSLHRSDYVLEDKGVMPQRYLISWHCLDGDQQALQTFQNLMLRHLQIYIFLMLK